MCSYFFYEYNLPLQGPVVQISTGQEINTSIKCAKPFATANSSTLFLPNLKIEKRLDLCHKLKLLSQASIMRGSQCGFHCLQHFLLSKADNFGHPLRLASSDPHYQFQEWLPLNSQNFGNVHACTNFLPM